MRMRVDAWMLVLVFASVPVFTGSGIPYQSNRFLSEHGIFSAGDGKVTWRQCANEVEDPSLFELHSIEVVPDPPQRTRRIAVRIRGHLREDLEEGDVEYTARYGGLQVVTAQVDGCQKLAEEQSLPQCPIRAGAKDIAYATDIPWFVPPGQYTVDVESRTRPGNRRIFCLQIEAPILSPSA